MPGESDIERARAKRALQEAAREGRIQFAPSDKVVLAGEARVQIVLDAIARVLDNERISHAVVTDRSTVMDFAPDLRDLATIDAACGILSHALGVSVVRTDYIHEIANRIEDTPKAG